MLKPIIWELTNAVKPVGQLNPPVSGLTYCAHPLFVIWKLPPYRSPPGATQTPDWQDNGALANPDRCNRQNWRIPPLYVVGTNEGEESTRMVTTCEPAESVLEHVADAVSPCPACVLYATSWEHHAPSTKITVVRYCPPARVEPFAERLATMAKSADAETTIAASR